MTTEREAQLYTLIHDCLDAYEMLSDQILVKHVEELSDDQIFAITARLHDRFRALAPEYAGTLPLETPDITETFTERLTRLTKE